MAGDSSSGAAPRPAKIVLKTGDSTARGPATPPPLQAPRRQAPISFTMNNFGSPPDSPLSTPPDSPQPSHLPTVVSEHTSPGSPPLGLKYPFGDEMDWEPATMSYEIKWPPYDVEMEWEDTSWNDEAAGVKGSEWCDWGMPPWN